MCTTHFKAHRDPNDNNKVYFPWYDRYFFYGNTQMKKGFPSRPSCYLQASYEYTRKIFKAVYLLIGIASFHILHLQRGTAARQADADGVNVHHIQGQGGWKRQGSLFSHYLISVPIHFCAWAAQYPNHDEMSEANCPVIKRGLVKPSQELVDSVFPFVPTVRRAMDSNPDDWDSNDHTLVGFLELCDAAAVFFLQDCAILYDQMNHHEIFSTPLLNRPEFFRFREKLLEKVKNFKDPYRSDCGACSSEEMKTVHSMLNKIYKKVGDLGGFTREADGRFVCRGQNGEVTAIVDGGFDNDSDLASFSVGESVGEDDRNVLSPITTTTLFDSGTTNDCASPPPEPPTYFGERVPAFVASPLAAAQALDPNRNNKKKTTSAKRKLPLATSSRKDKGCHFNDISTWPKETPDWAKNFPIKSKIDSPKMLVDEYLHGTPALRDLEQMYGDKAQKRGKTWRSGPRTGSNGTRNKLWCERKGIYESIGAHPRTAVGLLEAKIEEILSEHIPPGATAKQPGVTVMNKLISHYQKNREGSEERSRQGAERAKKRKLNKVMAAATENTVGVAMDGAVENNVGVAMDGAAEDDDGVLTI